MFLCTSCENVFDIPTVDDKPVYPPDEHDDGFACPNCGCHHFIEVESLEDANAIIEEWEYDNEDMWDDNWYDDDDEDWWWDDDDDDWDDEDYSVYSDWDE